MRIQKNPSGLFRFVVQICAIPLGKSALFCYTLLRHFVTHFCGKAAFTAENPARQKANGEKCS